MAKRTREEPAPKPEIKAKRVKNTHDQRPEEPQPKATSLLLPAEVDFPRGGGSSFTPLETKAIHAEVAKELNDEQVFQDSEEKKAKQRKRASLGGKASGTKNSDADRIRVEHLNYKRITIGQRLFCQITHIHPLALILSLPNQLTGHVPITHISSLLTARLEALQQDSPSDQEDEEDEEKAGNQVPDLHDLFYIGQYLPAVVTEVRPAGAKGSIDLGKWSRDEAIKGSRRVELSIDPGKVNAGVGKADLNSGFNIPATIKSVEDHGYILDLGVPGGISGFLSLKEAKKRITPTTSNGDVSPPKPLSVGQVVNTSVVKMSENGRTVTLSVDPTVIRAASITEASTVTSVLPGTLVHALITAVLPWGLNVQLLGFFAGTLDSFHLLSPSSIETKYKVGQKIKTRVLWDIPTNSPRTFALSVLPHIISLGVPQVDATKTVQSAYPVGAVIEEEVVVERVESEWGLVCTVGTDAKAFVHISHVSDSHVPSLSESSGPWKIGSKHRARVIGFSAVDGLLQLSLKPSVIDQKFLRASDVTVGEVVRGTIKSLSDVGLFVAISDEVDGVVWPLHFADIRLKNPERRFKVGGSVKCRVLSVDPDRNRISLTLKKTLVESDLPIIGTFEDAAVGALAHAVVTKLLPKSILITYYGGVKAFVPLREATEERITSAEGHFTVGQVVRTRITSVEPSADGGGRIGASIRQAAPNYKAPISIDSIALGSTVTGTVVEVQRDNIALTLAKSKARALLSINNLAKKRGVTPAKLKESLKVGEKLEELTVVSRNLDKALIIVSAATSSSDAKKGTADGKSNATPIDIDTVQVGDAVSGRVVSQGGKLGSTIRLTNSIVGYLHPTDTSDDFSSGDPTPYPPLNTVVQCVVASLEEKERRRLTLSTRPSRVNPEAGVVVRDPEVTSLNDLKKGMKLRGFVRSVADHGLFVSVGRGIDARVQIKELFDEYVKDWKPRFSVNQIVEGRVNSVDLEKNQVELTFKSGELSKTSKPSLSLGDLTVGDNVDCVVKKVEPYGLFVEVKDSKISGLCHKTEISDNKSSDVSRALKLFKEGDTVRARILAVDLEKRRVNFGLKPSYFADETHAIEEDENENEDADVDEESNGDGDADMADAPAQAELDASGDAGSDPSDDEDQDGDEKSDDDNEDEDVVMLEEPQAESSSAAQRKAAGGAAPVLQLQGGLRWGLDADDGALAESGESSSEDEEANEATTSKSRKKKRKHEIEKDMTTEMHTKTPESTADFERLLLGSPNSSFMWMQYMSFQLQLSEIDKAREVGQRALKAINFREEQEKLNIWIALLNLENTYGTDDTLEAVFRESARHNDSKAMHLRLAAILDETDKHDKAEEMYKRTAKKFGQSSKVWTLYGEHYLNRGKLEEARKILPRSLLSLEKRKHLKTISKFAQLEYKLGDAERGKTIFEGIIDSHPKRLDLWSVYMDMEAVQKNIQSLRNIFDRVFTQKLSSKKAKFFFKKWLALERTLGDEEGAEAVKARAIAWTQKGDAA